MQKTKTCIASFILLAASPTTPKNSSQFPKGYINQTKPPHKLTNMHASTLIFILTLSLVVHAAANQDVHGHRRRLGMSSKRPSASPSTATPSMMPSDYPSVNPSTAIPSIMPSSYPSVSPSGRPSNYPSLSPTNAPSTSMPSTEETTFSPETPTKDPTVSPETPTLSPSPTVMPDHAVLSYKIAIKKEQTDPLEPETFEAGLTNAMNVLVRNKKSEEGNANRMLRSRRGTTEESDDVITISTPSNIRSDGTYFIWYRFFVPRHS